MMKMKLRNDVTNIANELAEGQGLDFDVRLAAELIQSYCYLREVKSKPRSNEYKIVNGLLYINGEPIERVAPLPKKMEVEEKACYWENKILKKQEEWF